MLFNVKNSATKEPVMVNVKFKHIQGNENRTQCTLSADEGVIVMKNAYCSPNDNFNKAIGRKVALKKAIAHMSKGMRKSFWDEYFRYCPNDK